MIKDDDLLALWEVARVALVSMMLALMFGTYLGALFPKQEKVPVYECDFNMGKSLLTRPCTIRGEIAE